MEMFHSPPEPLFQKQPQKRFLSAVLEKMAPHRGSAWNTSFAENHTIKIPLKNGTFCDLNSENNTQ